LPNYAVGWMRQQIILHLFDRVRVCPVYTAAQRLAVGKVTPRNVLALEKPHGPFKVIPLRNDEDSIRVAILARDQELGRREDGILRRTREGLRFSIASSVT
jgi:hypothetical protein